MKLKRIFAGMTAAAMALAMTVVAHAETTFTKDEGGGYDGTDAFIFNDFDVMSEPDAVFEITYSDEHDNWGNIGFGFAEGEDWKSNTFNDPAGEHVVLEITVADVIEQCGIEDVTNLSYGKIEAYNGCIIEDVAVRMPEADPDDDNTDPGDTDVPSGDIVVPGEGSDTDTSNRTTFTKVEGGGYEGTDAFEFDNFDVLRYPEAIVVITYTDEHDNWGNIGFGFAEGEDWRSNTFNDPAGEHAVIQITVADIIKECGIEDISAIGYGKIEGYNGCLIENVEVIYPELAEPGTDPVDVVLKDEATDITVAADSDVIPEGTKLNVTEDTAAKTETSVTYDITLTDADGNAIQPNGTVTVTIAVPEGWATDSLYVYRAEADGSYTDMKATYADGYMVFTTDHFSTYILSAVALTADTTPDDTTGGDSDDTTGGDTTGDTTGDDNTANPGTGAAGAALALVAVAGAALAVSKKKN